MNALNLVHLHAYVPPLSPVPGERPRTSALARHQAPPATAPPASATPVRLEDDLEGEIERRLRDLAGQAMLEA